MLKQVFIDCMPGPTNHYGGHAYGNIASMKSRNKKNNPKLAALEWLEKVKEVKKNVARAMTELRDREIAAAEELEESDD